MFIAIAEQVSDVVFRGLTPAQAETSFLNKVKTLEMYGVDMHVVLVRSLFFELIPSQ